MSTESKILDGYLSRPELAKQIGKHWRTLERWGIEREGPPITWLGKQPFYKIASVRQWLESREQRIPRKSRQTSANAAA
jgi:hypothetical protein